MKKAWKSGLFWSGLIPFGVGIISPIIVSIIYGVTGRYFLFSPTQTDVGLWIFVILVAILLFAFIRWFSKDKKHFDEYCKFWLNALKDDIFPLVLIWLALSIFGNEKMNWVTGWVNFVYLLIMAQKIVLLFIKYSHMVEEDMEKPNIKNLNNNFH